MVIVTTYVKDADGDDDDDDDGDDGQNVVCFVTAGAVRRASTVGVSSGQFLKSIHAIQN